jgi:hypothetical protein
MKRREGNLHERKRVRDNFWILCTVETDRGSREKSNLTHNDNNPREFVEN